MASLPNTIKKAFLWTYERNTWQWDALCALILVFIFLTPKSWFEASERHARGLHQNPTSATVYVIAEAAANEEDKGKLQERVRVISGQPNAEVVAVRKVQDKDGRILGYQVDIR